MNALKTSGKTIRKIVALPAGFYPNGESKPRRDAQIIRQVKCPTTGKFDTTPKFYLVEYLDTGESEIAAIQEGSK